MRKSSLRVSSHKRVLIQVPSAALLARLDSYAARKAIADKLDGVDITTILRLKATRTGWALTPINLKAKDLFIIDEAKKKRSAALSCSAVVATPGWSTKSNLLRGTTLAASAGITRPGALGTHAAPIAASEETSTTGPTAKTARHPFAVQTATAQTLATGVNAAPLRKRRALAVQEHERATSFQAVFSQSFSQSFTQATKPLRSTATRKNLNEKTLIDSAFSAIDEGRDTLIATSDYHVDNTTSSSSSFIRGSSIAAS
ncbi:hypothetical protein MBM_03672 [Drepanopeziza brunnea f. sp. 'multigermtubi' MB_m1]|uniref:Uncharacterized protein n=1 Tax=Marssonina brunnea f. sp. multigermtubi (strain MB_m1) TaxID=1072389 RepID=K1WJN0_MARBU|nr:uncharacterized protein MBM_03672 [Drepanopeziza brunnea f. sp. 'multigermtubi' MB_m1]EKD17900.1 hypothetical protein MBM_03672 [Drepanopeziza brunnea f. sp. 'multigermtubi' MB_m1]